MKRGVFRVAEEVSAQVAFALIVAGIAHLVLTMLYRIWRGA